MSTPAKEPAPQRCVTLVQLVEHERGEWLEPRRAGEVIEYRVPERADARTRAYLSRRAQVDTPHTGLARLPAARVHGAGVVLSADGTLLARDVAEDFGKAPDAHWLLGLDSLRAPTPLDGTTAVVAVNRGAGYCHWLLEELPRLLALPRDAVDHVITHATSEPARAAWARRGGHETLIEARRHAHHAVGPLWVPALAAYAGAPTVGAVRSVRDFAQGLGTAAAGQVPAASRVYISRARAARRRVSNEDALWRTLEQAGFARVFLEDLSWGQQIATMQAARVVVAPHGAGLANLLFCAPGTRVVELVNGDYFNPVFWRLASLVALDYRPVVTPDAEREPIREEQMRNRDNIVADIARVQEALAQD